MPDTATMQPDTQLSTHLQEVERQEKAGEPMPLPFRPVTDPGEASKQSAALHAAAMQEYSRQQREAAASNSQLQIMKASTNGARNELELVRAGLLAKYELIKSIIDLKTDELDDTRKAILSIDTALQALA